MAGQPTAPERQLRKAARLVVRTQFGSIGMLQRQMQISRGRAAALMDMLEANGVVGPAHEARARDVLLTPDRLDEAFYASLSVTQGPEVDR